MGWWLKRSRYIRDKQFSTVKYYNSAFILKCNVYTQVLPHVLHQISDRSRSFYCDGTAELAAIKGSEQELSLW